MSEDIQFRKKPLTLATFLSLSTYGITLSVIGPAVSSIQSDFKITTTTVGFLFTFQYIAFTICVLFGGYLIDRLGIKLATLISEIILGFGAFLFSLSPATFFLFVGIIVIGIGGGLVECATNTIVATVYKNKRGMMLNLLHVCFGIGAFFGPYFSGYLIAHNISWRFVYLTIFIICIISLLFYFLCKFPQNVETDKVDMKLFKNVILNKYAILLGIIALLYAGVEMAINNFGVLYMEKELSFEKIIAAKYLSYFWLAMTFGRIICVYLAKIIKEGLLLFLLSFGSSIFFVIFLISDSKTMAGGSLAMVGFFYSGIFALLMALGANKFERAIATIQGITLTFCGIGLAFFPLVIGAISHIINMKYSFMMLGGFSIAMTIFSFIISKSK